MDIGRSVILRRADERGEAEHGWLHSRFSFSFAEYYDSAHMGFGALRVINDDIIEGGGGFDKHPHHDMEIITYVVEGALEHKDSTGTGSILRPGDVQRMTAGSGISHSEFNPQPDQPTRLLQIWILPEQEGLEPGYEQIRVDPEEMRNQLRVVASRDGHANSLTINQDACLLAARLDPGATLSRPVAAGRRVWVQLVYGQVRVNGQAATAGDGIALVAPTSLEIEATTACELLIFDLA
jgi:redox-sensitive bicupin YhaK (pirin superfamily)